MGTECVRTLDFPCRLGEITLCSPRRRLWVYRAGLGESVAEAALVERFRAAHGAFDGALLYGIPLDAGGSRLGLQSGLLRYVPHEATRHLIRLEGSFDEYMARFAAKTRSTLRRKIRRFEREAGAGDTFREYRGSAELLDFLRHAREVSARSYQERLLDAGLPDGDAFREELYTAGANDSVRGYLLFHGDTPVAYLYCPVADGVARYEHVGYDPRFQALSPGTVLLLRVLRRLFRDPGVGVFDFTEGGGDGSHKAFFATETLPCGNVYYLHPNARNVGVLALRTGADVLSAAAGGVLGRLGIKARVRHYLRALRGRA